VEIKIIEESRRRKKMREKERRNRESQWSIEPECVQALEQSISVSGTEFLPKSQVLFFEHRSVQRQFSEPLTAAYFFNWQILQ
jgi:hypothetical protein